MPDDDDEIPEIQLIGAMEDAQLRLDCFRAIAMLKPAWGTPELCKEAQKLYNWVMEYEGQEDPAPITPEDQCERRH